MLAGAARAQGDIYQISIEKTHRTYQGDYEQIDITVTDGSQPMWGFDLLITYDDVALSFQGAQPGSVYDSCGWEYFTFRTDDAGTGCVDDCPGGLVRVVGLAETNDGPNHPTCYDAAERTLAVLEFFVSNDRTYECQFLPIQFFWHDCGDNAVAFNESIEPDPYSQKLGVNRYITDRCEPNIADGSTSFPTLHGVPDSCLEGDQNAPVRFIDFHNGGIKTMCADSIDARGDINLDGIVFGVADAILFSNYFVYGPDVFSHPMAQAAASDVNSDGEELTLEDLMCLWLLIDGKITRECQPPPPPTTYSTFELSHSTLSLVDTEPLGILYLTLRGEANPDLYLADVEMLYVYDPNEDVTRVLIYDAEARHGLRAGDVLFLDNHELLEISAATLDAGAVVMQATGGQSDVVVLEQNYPNPFVLGPGTTTEIYAVSAYPGTGRIEIFNTLGQLVYSVPVEFLSAGSLTIEWSGTNANGERVAPGVYFYRLTFGETTVTRKMMLLK